MALTATHHAVLFALLSKEVLNFCGDEKGQQIIRRAVQKYGEQRGCRMRLRAQRDGEPLTMQAYLAYGEWRGVEGETAQRCTALAPDQHSFVDRCPWNQAWMEAGLLRYGRLYCLEIDLALVRGFNPDLKLEVLSTLSNDHQACHFIFRDANLTPENLQKLEEKRLANQRNGGVMSWEYHAGHLYQTIRSVLMAEFEGEAEAILQEAIDAFALHYGDEAAQVMLDYQAMDFDDLPI